MKCINPSFEILTPIDREYVLQFLERVARTCYKSEDKITPQSAPKMIKALIRSEHFAMIEHYHITVKFICDRGVTHEIVRHRMASYAQESTRYCNYTDDKFGAEISFVDLATGFKYDLNDTQDWYKWTIWSRAMEFAERSYFQLIKAGATPQEARSVLPNSLKTELVVTMNLREWIHFFNLRVLGTTGAPHPQMKEAALPVLAAFADALPEVFGEQYVKVMEG